MRKLVSLGLLALIFSLFSGSAFSGNVDDCESLKDKSDAFYTPGLFGICVAWHNARENGNEQAMFKLEQKYLVRSDNSPIPGSGGERAGGEPFFECPCWKELSPAYVCSLDETAFQFITKFDEQNIDLSDIYFGTVFFNPFTPSSDFYQVTPELDACTRIMGNEEPIRISLDTAEGYICGYELGEIAKLTPIELCAP